MKLFKDVATPDADPQVAHHRWQADKVAFMRLTQKVVLFAAGYTVMHFVLKYW